MKRHQKKIGWFCVATLIICQLAACNGLGGKPVDKNVLLKQRLDSYIEARKKNDLNQLRRIYLEPERVKVGNIVVKESVIISIVINDDKLHAQTKIENNIQAMGFTFNNIPMLLDWVWKTDNWYIKPSASAMNPFLNQKTAPVKKTGTDSKDK